MTNIKPHVWPELTEPKFGEWYPIDTAPKDGTKILVYNPVFGWYSSAWHSEKLDSLHTKQWEGFPCGYLSDFGKWYLHATHWTPLPAPPK